MILKRCLKWTRKEVKRALLYNWFSSLNSLEIFKYISFRSCLAAFTAFLISIIFGYLFIKKLRTLKVGEDTTKTDSVEIKRMHFDKKNTPTMGGIVITISISIGAHTGIGFIFPFQQVYMGYTACNSFCKRF